MSSYERRLPEAQRRTLRRAQWLQLVWILVLFSIIAAIYLSAGNSQAMKTAWIEDALSLVPPIAFLAATWIEGWEPNARFPLGYVRVSSISYLVSSVALAGVAIFLIIDSTLTLIRTEHATIGSAEIFGTTLWFGWVMIAALLYSVIPPVIFGRLKMKPARELHDKTLWADAFMNKADWLTGLAGIVGVLGIGIGWWWADAVAAMIIAADVLRDGFKHTRAAIHDLMDEMPKTVDDSEFEPLIDQVRAHLNALSWVEESRLRFSEEGRYLAGSIFLVTAEGEPTPERLEQLERDILSLHWRMLDVAIMPRSKLAQPLVGEMGEAGLRPLPKDRVGESGAR